MVGMQNVSNVWMCQIRARSVILKMSESQSLAVTQNGLAGTRFPSKKLTPRPCPKLLLLTVPAPRPSERCASSPPGPPRHGTRTALISLVISKLVRFHKSALAPTNNGIIIPLGRRRRAAFWHCRGDARMARLRHDSASGSGLGHEVSCPVDPAKARWETENRENKREYFLF